MNSLSPSGSPGDVTHFDADTALEPVADGRWRASAPDNRFVGRGPNGGFLAGVAEAGAGRPLRSLALVRELR